VGTAAVCFRMGWPYRFRAEIVTNNKASLESMSEVTPEKSMPES